MTVTYFAFQLVAACQIVFVVFQDKTFINKINYNFFSFSFSSHAKFFCFNFLNLIWDFTIKKKVINIFK